MTYSSAYQDDLECTGNHILPLIQFENANKTEAKYAGPTLGDHAARLANRIVQPNSSLPANLARNSNKRVVVDDFRTAIRRGMGYALKMSPTPQARQSMLSALNGTAGIQTTARTYKVLLNGVTHAPRRIGKREETQSFKSFTWGSYDRTDEVFEGNPDYPTETFDTQEEAAAAARAFNREWKGNGLTIETLHERFLEKSSSGKAGNVKVDYAIKNLFLQWTTNIASVAIVFSTTVDGNTYRRAFTWASQEFISLDTSSNNVADNSSTDEDDGESVADDDDVEPDVADLHSTMVVQDGVGVVPHKEGKLVYKTAQEVFDMPKDERKLHRLFRSGPIEKEAQEVPVDPYFLGLWLGDGSRSSTAISNNRETEIVTFLQDHAEGLDMHLQYHGGLTFTTVQRKRKDIPMPILQGPVSRDPVRPERCGRRTLAKRRLDAGWILLPRGAVQSDGTTRWWIPPPDDAKIVSMVFFSVIS